MKSKCRYCFGGYCENKDVRAVELRTRPGGKWDGGESTAGAKCREYLRGHFRYIKAQANGSGVCLNKREKEI